MEGREAMTVQRVRRDADVFKLTCNTCGTHTHVRATDQFQLARIAGRTGWTCGAKADRCKACPPPKEGKPRKR